MNDKLLQFCNIDKWHTKGITGKSVKVAVLETDCNPSLFNGKVKDPFNVGSYDVQYSHGNNFLHVLFQVAPDIEVYLMPSYYPHSPSLIDGYKYCLENNIKLYGKSTFLPYGDDVRNFEKQCYDKGLFFTCASGNESTDMESLASRGYTYEHWYTVGAIHMDVNNNLILANYNNYGDELDIMGFSNIEIRDINDKNKTYFMSGTSFACPWLLGMIALVKQIHANMTNLELKQFIIQNSIDLGTLGFDQYYGNGLFILPQEVDTMEIKLKVGSNLAYIDGQQVVLDVPPTVVNGRTLVPIRFIADAFDCTTIYNNGEITIKK